MKLNCNVYFLFHSNLHGCRSTTDDCNIPFVPCLVYRCHCCGGKVCSCPLFDVVFPPFILSACSSLSVHLWPCRIVFARPEDIEMWLNPLSFHFLTMGRSSLYSQMATFVFLWTPLLVMWSSVTSGSFWSQRPLFFSLTVLCAVRSIIHKQTETRDIYLMRVLYQDQLENLPYLVSEL